MELEPDAGDYNHEHESIETESRFKGLWENGNRLEAIGLVMGRAIVASEVEANPRLQLILTESSSSDAYAAAVITKGLEDIHGKY